MFTGIVEEVGTVRRVLPSARAGKIVVAAKKVLSDVHFGDSIAVNGVCLTVTSFSADEFTADVMPETLKRSNLGSLKAGDPVDLERAMAAGGRFGGHIVSGHIDGVGTITQIRPDQNAVWVTIRTTPDILALIVQKGSIAIDGVSLTVASLGADTFSVSLIPTTRDETILLRKRPGDVVNLENDVVGKCVQRLLGAALGQEAKEGRAPEPPTGSSRGSAGALSLEYLVANGF